MISALFQFEQYCLPVSIFKVNSKKSLPLAVEPMPNAFELNALVVIPPAEIPSFFWELAALVPSKNLGDAHSVKANSEILF